MKPRWHKAKVNMDFFKGNGYVMELKRQYIVFDGDNRYVHLTGNQFADLVLEQNIVVKETLSLKPHRQVQDLFRTAQDYTRMIFLKPGELKFRLIKPDQEEYKRKLLQSFAPNNHLPIRDISLNTLKDLQE